MSKNADKNKQSSFDNNHNKLVSSRLIAYKQSVLRLLLLLLLSSSIDIHK